MKNKLFYRALLILQIIFTFFILIQLISGGFFQHKTGVNYGFYFAYLIILYIEIMKCLSLFREQYQKAINYYLITASFMVFKGVIVLAGLNYAGGHDYIFKKLNEMGLDVLFVLAFNIPAILYLMRTNKLYNPVVEKENDIGVFRVLVLAIKRQFKINL